MHLHLVHDDQAAEKTPDHHCYLSSAGRGVNMIVAARCSCGWAGPPRRWGPGAIAGEQADLDQHLAASGHAPVEEHLTAHGGVHPRCGHHHDDSHDCPVPYDSPAGLLVRTVQSTLGRPGAAADRLRAASQLARWVADEQTQAVISAYIVGLDWDQIATAADLPLDDVQQRSGSLIGHLETAQLLCWDR